MKPKSVYLLDYVICPYCGKKLQTLITHIGRAHNKSKEDLYKQFTDKYDVYSIRYIQSVSKAGTVEPKKSTLEYIHSGRPYKKCMELISKYGKTDQ